MERYAIVVKDLKAVGDTVIADVLQKAKGKTSGIETEDSMFMLFTFRGESIVRMETVRGEGRRPRSRRAERVADVAGERGEDEESNRGIQPPRLRFGTRPPAGRCDVGAVFLARRPTRRWFEGRRNCEPSWESQVDAVDIRMEPDEFISVGNNKVVVPSRMVAHGRSSEISLTATVVWVFTIDSDGLVTSAEAFDSRDEALKAAGLNE